MSREPKRDDSFISMICHISDSGWFIMYKNISFLGTVFCWLLSAIFFLLFSIDANAQDKVLLDSFEGVVQVQRVGDSRFESTQAGTEISLGDKLKTGENSRATIKLPNGGYLRIAKNTIFQIKDDTVNGLFSLQAGNLYFFGREDKHSPSIETPHVTTAIRGTEFTASVHEGSTEISVLDGAVLCKNVYGEIIAQKGEVVKADSQNKPVKSLLLHPKNAVQWTIYSPSILSGSSLKNFFPESNESEELAYDLISKGDYEQALLLLAPDSLKFKIASAFVLESKGDTEKASIILSDKGISYSSEALTLNGAINFVHGSVVEAENFLNEAMKNTQKTSLKALILSQLAMIYLAKDELGRAVDYLEQARGFAPNIPEILLVDSYVSQAKMQMENALATANDLATRDPYNVTSFVRKAEVNLSFGKLKEARDDIARALRLNPSDPYALTINGFVLLFTRKLQESIVEFKRAQELAPGFSLPILGNALALIKQGNLESGRIMLEKASFLSPNVSIYRSYLGKAYYEAEKSDLSSHELERAISLDPLDPTPYLYKAYNDLENNRPVEALNNIESSIERNNNRAVYRSNLLIDQDLASRSASLGEVFNSLGFYNAGRVEAIKSISRDYTNYSAHLLLSDTYTSILENDASVAERRIVELLSPVSFNLFQHPEGEASLNEYNSLFDRPDSKTRLSLEASTYEDLFVPGALYAKKGEDYAYSLEVRSLMTGGSKHGDYSRLEEGKLRGAYDFGYDNRVTLRTDALYNKIVEGSPEHDDSFIEAYDFGAGFLHKFSPNSNLIVDLSYGSQNNRFMYTQFERPSILDEIYLDEEMSYDNTLLLNELSRESVKGFQGAIQHAYDSRYVSSVLGYELRVSDVDRKESSEVLADDLGLFDGYNYYLRTRGANDLFSNDIYSYLTFHTCDYADITAGGSYTFIELESREITPFIDGTRNNERFNPKVGLTVYPTDALTIRAAYFESLRKSSLEDVVSIEPTLIGGINQRFNDLSGAYARNFGGGFDYKVKSSTYFGAEALRRHVTTPFQDGISVFTLDVEAEELWNSVEVDSPYDLHQDQNILKGYFSQVITDRLVSSLDSAWFDVERTDPSVWQDISLTRISETMRYFHPGGLYPYLNLVWREQSRDGSDFFSDGRDGFLLTNIGVGYRIPNRQGAIELEFSNIFNEDFEYDQSAGLEPYIHDGFGVSLRTTIRF